MPVVGSKRSCRLRPLSITRRTPSMVTELSAIPLASTSLPSRLAGRRFTHRSGAPGQLAGGGQICQCLRASAAPAVPGSARSLPVQAESPALHCLREIEAMGLHGTEHLLGQRFVRPRRLVQGVDRVGPSFAGQHRASGSRERRSAMSKVADISIRLRSGRSRGLLPAAGQRQGRHRGAAREIRQAAHSSLRPGRDPSAAVAERGRR